MAGPVTGTSEIPFDDLDRLRALVSTDFGEWGTSHEITPDDVEAYVTLVGHPRVEAEPVPGFLVLALLSRVSSAIPVRVTGHSVSVNYGARRIDFGTLVPVGTTIHARSRLAGVESRSDGGTLLTIDWDIRPVGADDFAVRYQMLVLYR